MLLYWADRAQPHLLSRRQPQSSPGTLSLMQLGTRQNPSSEGQVDDTEALEAWMNMPLMPSASEQDKGHVVAHVMHKRMTQAEGQPEVRFRSSLHRAGFNTEDWKRGYPGEEKNKNDEANQNRDVEHRDGKEASSVPDIIPDLENEGPPATPPPQEKKQEEAEDAHQGHEDVGKVGEGESSIPDVLPDLEENTDPELPTPLPTGEPHPGDGEAKRKQAKEEKRKKEAQERQRKEIEKKFESEKEQIHRREKEAIEEELENEGVKDRMKKEIREDMKEEIRKDLEDDLRNEKSGIREEIEEDIEEDVEKEVKQDVEKEVKKELAEEGLGREERMSEIGERALEDRWFTFVAAAMFLLLLAAITFAVCYFAPHWVEGEDDDDEPVSGRSLPDDAEPLGYVEGIKYLLYRPVNFMLVLVPIGLVCHFWARNVGYTAIFWINILAIVPEAYIVGIATEEIALMMGDVAGAIWNATFGNVVELIFIYLTLREGLITVCEGSIVGAILCNHVLLLGFCFLLGGTALRSRMTGASTTKFQFGRELEYDSTNALNQAQQLLVASFAVTLPSLFAEMQHVTLKHVMVLSRAVSCFIVVSYCALVTHQLVSMPSKEVGLRSKVSKGSAFTMLVGATILCALSSEVVVEAVSGFAIESGYSKSFLGLVVLPIAGDLTHVSAVYMAMKGKMELAVGISLASSIQVAMVLLPTAVWLGYFMDQPMTLNLRSMHSVMLVVSSLITFAVMVDGKSNWLRGFTLLTTFFMIALIVFFQPDL